MANKTTRYVVDVSDLIHWQGHLSGIQRVVAEMAYRYEKEGAVFCYYEEATQQFYPLGSFVAHMEQRQASSVYQVPHSKGESYSLQAARFLKRAGMSVTPPIALKVARRIKKAATVEQVAAGDARETFIFKDDDTVLVFGGHWDKPHYAATLAGIKSHYNARVAHVVYDLIPVYDRAHVAEVEHTRFPVYIKAISELSDIVYVISESTKRDYLRFLKENNIKRIPDVHVVILGENFSYKKAVKPEGFTEKEYILAVGTIEVRKNYGLLYSAYRLAAERGVDLPKLVVVGRQGWLSGDIYYQMVHDSVVADKITFIHNADDNQLSWLYENCLFTTYPSFYEGWGLPVAEAAFYKKACAASNASSIPEVVGELAEYFSPFSADEYLAAIQKLLDKKYRHSLEAKLARRKPVDWDETFQQVKQAL